MDVRGAVLLSCDELNKKKGSHRGIGVLLVYMYVLTYQTGLSGRPGTIKAFVI